MTAGVFRLILRDQRYDDLMTASDYLRERLKSIRLRREVKGESNPQPTFFDLERSHIMYMRGVYRPFVALACEYVKVQSSGGSAVLTSGGGTAKFTFPIYGQFTSDMVFRVKFNDVGTQNPIIIVDANNPPANPSPLFRYCAYPGIRLFERIQFKSDEVLIDEYTRDDMSFINKFRVSADRRAGWDRGMGQAEVQFAEYQNPNGFTGLLAYKEGLQSEKFFHAGRDLWVPLQFWMCSDASTALFNDLAPNTQRIITVDLAPLEEMIQCVDQSTREIIPLPFTKVGLQIDLFVNNIFVNPEVKDIFASRIGMTLIRVTRRQRVILNQSLEKVKFDQLKFPIEYMYFGVRDLGNKYDFDYWHMFGRPVTRGDADALDVPIAFWNASLAMCQLSCRTAKEVGSLGGLLDNIKLTAHGIDLYPEANASFYNTYLPQRYFARTQIVTPTDKSAYLITFCLYPGQFNPSGYYNLSAGRELYLQYTSSSISADQPAELVISASVINFLVRKGDKVALRYAV